jgi:hypothetical protein
MLRAFAAVGNARGASSGVRTADFVPLPSNRECYATVSDSAYTPGDEAEIVLDRRGGEQRLDHWRSMSDPAHHQAADRRPAPYDRTGQRQYSITEPCFERGDARTAQTVRLQVVEALIVFADRPDT